jgi:IS5 family transposase
VKDTTGNGCDNLLLVPFDSKKAKIFDEGLNLMQAFPKILSGIRSDQDARSLTKKELRIADAQWFSEHNQPILFEVEESTRSLSAPLGTGRPRLSAEAVFLFLVARGLYGSPCDEAAWERMFDSSTFRFYLQPYVNHFPGQTTVLEHLNSLKSETLEQIFCCQLSQVLGLDLDDLETIFVDSTHVHSRSSWPTDSSLILKALGRAYALGQKLETFGITNFRHWSCPRWMDELQKLDFAINMAKKKNCRQFRRTYGRFLEKAQKMENRLAKEYDDYDTLISSAELPPSRRKMLDALWELLLDSLVEANILNELAYRRVVLGEKVERENFEKILSASDRSAAFIEKGGREKVFGYRVQLSRSRHGFISSAIVPEGNAADSAMLVPVVEDHIDKSGIVPVSVSTDDGYSSEAGRRVLISQLKVKNVSINGAKGRRITSEEEWNSELFADLRNDRSAVESLMFTGKHKFGFGQFRRCGIDAVRAEMLEKVIAHNFWRIVHERQRQQAAGLVA